VGKIRTKIIGLDEVEKKQKKDAAVRREAKKQKKSAEKPEKEEIIESASIVGEPQELKEKAQAKEIKETKEAKENKKQKKEKKKAVIARKKGKKYQVSIALVEKKKQYELKEAVALLKKMKYASFDETVEIHLNLKEEGLKGEVSLPHGTGKQISVVIADDALLAKIDAGTIEFDVLIAAPSFMPKLVKYAKILGPKGLMPNPKNGTVSDKPEEAVKKFKSGGMRYKSESKFPLLHQSLGKISFKDEELIANIQSFVNAVQKKNINSIYLSLTMSPSVRVNIESI